MGQPVSTYRIQVSPEFTFKALREILDYLEELGVSTIYSAPFFQARRESTHGYDVLDPFILNTAIGSLEELKEIHQQLNSKKMTWLQDIVPNHMAFDGENPWIRDIFELGPDSRFYNFFDIDWNYKGWNKVMAPFLGKALEKVLDDRELNLQFDAHGCAFQYYENRFPASIGTYIELLSRVGEESYAQRFMKYSETEEQWEELKTSFLKKLAHNRDFKEKIAAEVLQINGSREEIERFLDLQFFLPTHWKQTEREINYRRFFTINGLICLRMEDPKVFETYHYFIKELCETGIVNGLRIDHIDGLFDPVGYLKQLRALVGENVYISVEKILESEESLPETWPVRETSGYDFLAQINHLFTQSVHAEQFDAFYAGIAPGVADYESLVYEKKLFILKKRMGGELHNLWMLLKENDLLVAEDINNEELWKEVISAFLAGFPVYRIYPTGYPLNEDEQRIVEIAYKRAVREVPQFTAELGELRELLLGTADAAQRTMLYFLQRCQQFSGPLAAKGVEDTAFYIYNRLVSHNEVGDSPEHFGISVAQFHGNMLSRAENLSASMNATATHDTKRGEDSRMRLNVLSEVPGEWFPLVDKWKAINSEIRSSMDIPGSNDEYFIYQTLLAGMPFVMEEDFISRTCDYLQKVLREAKVHSNWAEPNEEYEQGVFDFIETIMKHRAFRDSFDPFQKKIAAFGVIKSLAQVLIKNTAPGIPDTYQGTELWDLSYVDPDNRRAVDYGLRKSYLAEFRTYTDDNKDVVLQQLLQEYQGGKLKMYILYKTLQERKRNPGVFQNGSYIPVSLSGKNAENFICYARNHENTWYIILAPLGVTEHFNPLDLSLLPETLHEIQLGFHDGFPRFWTNVLTDESLDINAVSIPKLLGGFPVAFLKNKQI